MRETVSEHDKAATFVRRVTGISAQPRSHAHLLPRLGDELESRGVDAVPLPRRRRAVVEDVAQVDPRAGAHDLDAAHAHGEVRLLDDVVRVDGGGERRPAWVVGGPEKESEAVRGKEGERGLCVCWRR